MTKRLISLGCLLVCFAVQGSAQQVNAGYLNPVLGGSVYRFLRLGADTSYWGGIMWNNTHAGYGNGNDVVLFSYSARDINIQPNGGNFSVLSGNTGIGTTTPLEKLDVNGDLNIRKSGGGNDSPLGSVKFYNSYPSTSSVIAQIQARRGANSLQRGDLVFYVKDGTQLIESARINSNGDIGIGTATPREKLSVNGHIRAREVKVESLPWPDYVFNSEYDLRSLRELENYIRANGHLPAIPSARKVAENGIQLGEMNAKLLEKIEELTLYIIQQNKQLERLEEALKEKDVQFSQLEKRLLKLEHAPASQ